MKVVVSGGTGFIGSRLLDELLREGHQVILLSRRPGAAGNRLPGNLEIAPWDGRLPGPWQEKLEGADGVINLAGESIAEGRWTAERKARIVASRVDSTRAIVQAMAQAKKKPSVLVNASAVGYYGHVPEGKITESHPKGAGFLADTCARWEEEARRAAKAGARVVLARIGIVLAPGGGALAKMIPPFLFFAGGSLGSGRQWFPWIDRDDVSGAILFALKRPDLSGPVNVTAPEPVIMRDFSKMLGKALHRPSWAPVPGFALKMLLGEMAEMLLTGQCAVPEKLANAGYAFRDPHLEGALAHALQG
jgi:uncharacterized protein (TIGR01777 family)